MKTGRIERRKYTPLIASSANRKCGVAEVRLTPMERLKLEVCLAIDTNFWGNRSKPWRPKTDPGAGGFGYMKYGAQWPLQRKEAA